MQTIRRLYLYAFALISLETVLWGAIILVRSLLGGPDQMEPAELARSISLILVGIPVFLLHGGIAHYSAARNPEERAARIRAIFLYGALLVTLLPVVQNSLALINRGWLAIFGLEAWRAIIGGEQSWIDNLAAILMNGAAAAGINLLLRADRHDLPTYEVGDEVRRLYRAIWLAYSLSLAIAGSAEVIQFTLRIWESAQFALGPQLANGLALLLIGAPLWYVTDRLFQQERSALAETGWTLRVAFLYIVSLASLTGLLACLGLIVEVVLRAVLGEKMTPGGYLAEISRPVGYALPLGIAWAIYSRRLPAAIQNLAGPQAQPDLAPAAWGPIQPLRAGLRRVYDYILALFGYLAAFAGLNFLLAQALTSVVNGETLLSAGTRVNLSQSLAMIAIGAPVWLASWRPMAIEAAQTGETGDHARRSTVRKGYLYLWLFAGVIGLMVSAGRLVFGWLNSALGNPTPDLALESALRVKELVLFAVTTGFHGLALRRDSERAGRALERRHAQFPVLILAPDDPDFVDQLLQSIERAAPGLPVAVQPVALGVPDETLSAARAVILPADLVARPPEGLRLWLQGFTGARLVVPTPVKDWLWLFGSGRPMPALARQAAVVIRRLAEGEDTQPRESGFWLPMIYLMAGLFALELLFLLASLFFSILFR